MKAYCQSQKIQVCLCAYMLNELCSQASEISESEALDVFQVLTTTYSRYIDQPSRDAVETVLISLAKGEHVLKKIIKWINTESDRVCLGGSGRYQRVALGT